MPLGSTPYEHYSSRGHEEKEKGRGAVSCLPKRSGWWTAATVWLWLALSYEMRSSGRNLEGFGSRQRQVAISVVARTELMHGTYVRLGFGLGDDFGFGSV